MRFHVLAVAACCALMVGPTPSAVAGKKTQAEAGRDEPSVRKLVARYNRLIDQGRVKEAAELVDGAEARGLQHPAVKLMQRHQRLVGSAAAPAAEPEQPVTRIYVVQDLVENLAENRNDGWENLMGVLRHVDPQSWLMAEGQIGQPGVVGMMMPILSPAAPTALVICQTPAAHAQIEDLLEQLRQLYASPTGKAADSPVRAAGHTVQEEK